MDGRRPESARNQNSGPENGRADRRVLSVEDAPGFGADQSTLPLSGGLFQSFDHHDAGDFDEFAHGDPNQIRTAPHRYRSLQNTQRLVLDFQRPGPELESLSGRASRRPDPLVSRTAVTTPILRCAAGHRGRPYRFSNRHSVSRSEFAPGNFRFRLPHPQIWVFMRNGFRQKNRFFAHLLMCSL